MNWPVKIYALMRGAKIMYVGQSVYPPARAVKHHKKWKKFRLVTLRTCQNDQAARIESQVIKACKRRGLCEWNKRTHPMRVSEILVTGPYRVRVKETGEVFASPSHFMRAYAVARRTVYKALAADGWIHFDKITIEAI